MRPRSRPKADTPLQRSAVTAVRLHVDQSSVRPHPNLTDVSVRPRLRPSGEWTAPSQRSQIQTIETSGVICFAAIPAFGKIKRMSWRQWSTRLRLRVHVPEGG